MVLFSDFAQPTVSTSADTAGTTANLTYNGVGGHVYFLWGVMAAQTATAAQGIKPYALVTGTGIPGIVPNIPIGRWRSGYLAGASVGSVSADPSFVFPVDWNAPANGVVTFDVRNAASSTAPLAQVGLLYGSQNFQLWEIANGDPWNLRGVPKTCITATPTSVTSTTEAGIGTLTIPADYLNVLGLGTYGVTNGVRVTAEEFLGTARYTATGAGSQQFEPAQRWPFFGQQDAPVGTDIQDESFAPTGFFHPLSFTASANSTVQSLVTLRTAVTNATSFQIFAALR